MENPRPEGDAATGRHRKRYRKKHSFWRILRRIFTTLLLLFLIAGAGLYALVVKPEYDKLKSTVYDKLASVDVKDLTKLSDTKIYDTNGELLGIVNAGHFVYDDINDISMNLQNAYIAQEDRNFKVHHGVDYKATLRALLELIRNKGKITQGGSTITQQVVKNTYLSSERTFTRKFVEMMLARELEKMYTKAEIMELYCNTNFYGNNCYGVESASQYYFNKSARDLTVPEAAALAGISNAPSRYEPVRHKEACLEKRNQVLKSMLDCGYITEDEYKTYCATELSVSENTQEGTDEDYLSSYALHCAAITLMEVNHFEFEYLWTDKEAEVSYDEKYEESYNYYMNLLRSGGYEIYTTLDPTIQEEVQTQLDETLQSFTDTQENGKLALQGAAVVIDNKTDYVVAVVGGRGTEDKYNRAYLSVRQPGSAIKPLLDYAPALDSGEYTPATRIDDHKFDGGPGNSGGSYHGLVTLREAVNRSLNTVAWQVLADLGTKYGLQYLANMHFQGLSWVDTTTEAVSIGGFTNGVRVVDMARGYATLANNGHYSGKTCVTKIVQEKDGELTGSWQPSGAQVYREDTAFMMTDILKGTITEGYGTGHGLALDNAMPCAGKTGTTNESKDTWFCGYTKYYTMAVWVGYDQPTPMPGVYGATYAGKIWQKAMNQLHEGLEAEDWTQPDTVEMRTDPETGITDYASTTDTARAEASLQEKEEQKNESRAQELLTSYEALEISNVEDVYKEREIYQELKPLTDTLSDADLRKDILTRLLERKSYFDSIEAEMTDTIKKYEDLKEKESKEQQSIDASKAEEARLENEKEVNKQSFEDALKTLEELQYQDSDLESLINDAIDKLQYCGDLNEVQDYVTELNQAIQRARSLPTKSVYEAKQAESEAAASMESENESREIQAIQESLQTTIQLGRAMINN